jgi:signal transduction histidine kinase
MVNLSKQFKDLCKPAMIYFIISIISILIALANHIKLEAVLIKAIFVIFWTYVLNFLCKKGYKSVSWFLVLFPYILILAAVFGLVRESFNGNDVSGNQATQEKQREAQVAAIANANASNSNSNSTPVPLANVPASSASSSIYSSSSETDSSATDSSISK